MAEEIEKLKRMAQRGNRQRLGTLMKDISRVVAEEVVEEQPGLKPRVRLSLKYPLESILVPCADDKIFPPVGRGLQAALQIQIQDQMQVWTWQGSDCHGA